MGVAWVDDGGDCGRGTELLVRLIVVVDLGNIDGSPVEDRTFRRSEAIAASMESFVTQPLRFFKADRLPVTISNVLELIHETYLETAGQFKS